MVSLADRLQAALEGRYRVGRELGAGGMATVFEAFDVRHERDVAIKVLHPEIAPTVAATRFLQEIRIAAQLTHPHILTLIDSGASNELLYFVMPLVRGDTLRARIVTGGPIPTDEVTRILRDVLEGLAFAHSRGVVHRDVKPENIMLDGRHALVMDFGVAKAFSAAAGGGHQTTGGLTLGTPGYMSPEQVAADANIDHRTDIYAVGLLGWEMLAGRHPFAGLTPHQMMAAHVARVPDVVTTLRPDTPVWLAELVMRCLEKAPEARFATADDVLALLEPATTERTTQRGETRRLHAGWGIGAILLAAAVATVLLTRPRSTNVSLGRSSVVAADAGLKITPRLSPDGRLIVYSAGQAQRTRIYVRPTIGGRAIALTTDSVESETAPRWSPDGSNILYGTGTDVRVVPALGGTSKLLFKAPRGLTVYAAAWSPDGSEIAWTSADSVFITPVAGGSRRFLATHREIHSCDWSPKGTWLACASGDFQYDSPGATFGNIAASSIVLVPTHGGRPWAVTDSTSLNQAPSWARDESELYFVSDRDGPRDIYRQGLDGSGRPRGAPQRVSVGLNAHSVHVGADGQHMTYSVYAARANLWTARIPPTGSVSVSTATQLTTGSQTVESMTVSRDGAWVVFDSDLAGNSDVYRIPAAGGAVEQLTRTPEVEFRPELSPDGRFLAYHSFVAGKRAVYVLPLEGGSALPIAGPQNIGRPSWSPRGDALAFVDFAARQRPWVTTRQASGAWSTPVARDEPRSIARNSCFASPDWSADGLLAYCADGGGRVVHPDSGIARMVYTPDTSAGRPYAEWLMWSRTGAAFYIRGVGKGGANGFWRVDLSSGRVSPVLRFDDAARMVARAEFAVSATHLYFTVSDRQSDIWVADVKR